MDTFAEAAMDVPFARIESGIVSEIKIQEPGPQEYAKLMM
jgi:hypothetical protein